MPAVWLGFGTAPGASRGLGLCQQSSLQEGGSGRGRAVGGRDRAGASLPEQEVHTLPMSFTAVIPLISMRLGAESGPVYQG